MSKDTTDTNQANEDELDNILRSLAYDAMESGVDNSKHGYVYSAIDELLPTARMSIQNLIRTEKLKLLAEVREAHRDGYMRGVNDFSNYFMDASNAAQRTPIMPDVALELREAYRAPILSTKLEAEL